jgi:hypothetical protein
MAIFDADKIEWIAYKIKQILSAFSDDSDIGALP